MSVQSRADTPLAEIAEVWPRDGRIRVVGDIHGHPDPASTRWLLVLQLRDHDTRLTYDLPGAGARFDAAVPLADLVPADPGTRAAAVKWDLYLAPEDAADLGTDHWLRVGRRLDDIRGKKKIMVFPVQYVRSDDGTALAIQPFYTIKDNLSVECAPHPSESPGQATP
ncbi:hypothetical protein ACFPZ0_15950 [Streptomonospora nanhaiensis]|uniref:Uncharacterized protein n=1 Tax=Streptomonospora nanhaiensis TaxID=1323731 RepID=A0A853BK52_9ACTN|nr:hypothetical protein [Streptomonospora nanhaiensis]MBV2363284.1 hypothetical protein [Streptomonospora nanhaiensis]MBX9389910.1 hypothetical protein [Streptomonospora nanhaiensis]NYI95643.1 hypothetical protein [Streptomonospora nanhaiensis]